MSDIDAYLSTVTPLQKKELGRIRKAISDAVPGAQEVISYGIPAFKLNGHYLIGFAAFKNHMSIFPASGPVEVLRDKLEGFQISKGTIQFTHKRPLPQSLLREIIKQCQKSVSERQ